MKTSPRAPASKVQPSPFWQRLADAFSEKWSPFNPNALAKRLDMSQGAAYRWYTGQSLPELQLLIYLATEAGTTVDWLARGVRPEHWVSDVAAVNELVGIVEQLSPAAQQAVLRVAKGELLQAEAMAAKAAAPAGKRRA